jgi:deoxyribodipyrimidine photo-lyase
MSQEWQIQGNAALQTAQDQALRLEVPLAVVFCLLPDAKAPRILDGLRKVETGLAELNIPLMVVIGDPVERLGGVLYHLKPQVLVFDSSPLGGPQKLIAEKASCVILEVDTSNDASVQTTNPPASEAKHVKRHPYDWPGEVRSLDELWPLINEARNKTC